ncbi:MAG: hypothetical protein F2844_04575, partial [Actinobacteria bacterium]|nr:hypothetical protein [Actinomycetota bacterium]
MNAELAFNEVDNTLYYGYGDVAGAASSILAIGGPGAFTTLTSCQTISGDKTFTGSLTAVTQANATNSNLVATTAFVTNKLANLTNVVNGFNSRTGNVTLTTGDVTAVANGTYLVNNVSSGNLTLTPSGTSVEASIYQSSKGAYWKTAVTGSNFAISQVYLPAVLNSQQIAWGGLGVDRGAGKTALSYNNATNFGSGVYTGLELQVYTDRVELSRLAAGGATVPTANWTANALIT